MSMTREQAIGMLEGSIDDVSFLRARMGWSLADRQVICDELRLALSILAPEPRKEPPTVEGGNVWYSDAEDVWVLTAVDYVRKHWRDGEQWLPESALPKGDV